MPYPLVTLKHVEQALLRVMPPTHKAPTANTCSWQPCKAASSFLALPFPELLYT